MGSWKKSQLTQHSPTAKPRADIIRNRLRCSFVLVCLVYSFTNVQNYWRGLVEHRCSQDAVLRWLLGLLLELSFPYSEQAITKPVALTLYIYNMQLAAAVTVARMLG
jgi:hypothetical protein